MKLIVGLGNPGAEYDRTRHNVGFLVLDRLARRGADPVSGGTARSRFHGLLVEGSFGGEKTLLLRPTTYMNRSGVAVAEAIRFYKLEPSEALLVVVDDVALPCGMIRMRPGGSPGGHNGLVDIDQRIGTSDYARCRIGIDPPGQIPQKDYVLGRFRPDQLELVEPSLDEAADAAACWVSNGITEAMNRYNRRNTA